MKILILSASPRKGSNSDILADKVIEGAKSKGAEVEKIYLKDLDVKPCRGCLRCNILGYCSIKKDDFKYFRDKFLESRAIVFSLPLYFHYIPGYMKVLLDRFRSLFHVHILADGLKHTRRYDFEKAKKFFFIVTQGSPLKDDAFPAIEGLRLWAETSCKDPLILPPVIATFLALPGQIMSSREKLALLFEKMEIPSELVDEKYDLYQSFLSACYRAGEELAEE